MYFICVPLSQMIKKKLIFLAFVNKTQSIKLPVYGTSLANAAVSKGCSAEAGDGGDALTSDSRRVTDLLSDCPQSRI